MKQSSGVKREVGDPKQPPEAKKQGTGAAANGTAAAKPGNSNKPPAAAKSKAARAAKSAGGKEAEGGKAAPVKRERKEYDMPGQIRDTPLEVYLLASAQTLCRQGGFWILWIKLLPAGHLRAWF